MGMGTEGRGFDEERSSTRRVTHAISTNRTAPSSFVMTSWTVTGIPDLILEARTHTQEKCVRARCPFQLPHQTGENSRKKDAGL